MSAFARAGYHALMTKSFGSQIRGGESSCRLRVSTRPIHSLGGDLDLAVALNWDDFLRFGAELPIGGQTTVLWLSYGCGFVAQGTPADMSELATLVEEAIRYPGFAFVNVLSPCVTFGEPEEQLRMHKQRRESLASLRHDPADRLKAMALAEQCGDRLLTGLFYRNPEPPPSYELRVRELQSVEREDDAPQSILEAFRP